MPAAGPGKRQLCRVGRGLSKSGEGMSAKGVFSVFIHLKWLRAYSAPGRVPDWVLGGAGNAGDDSTESQHEGPP